MGKLMYKGVPYSATGEVEANPQGTPSDILDSIKINGTVYGIEGGAGIFIGNVPTNYNTEEKVIGTWTDGKPLYQKTKTFTVPSNSYETFPMNIDNFEKACDYRAIVHDGSHIDVNYNRPDRNEAEFYVVIESNGDFFMRSFRTTTATVTVTIQYTKTTDIAYTVPVGYSDYYSTDEQIVGRWIDGKPLYQKTFSGTLPNTEPISNYFAISLPNNIDSVATIGGLLNDIIPINSYYSDSNYNIFFINSTKTNIVVNGRNISGNDFIVTIQYTKTTD